MEEQGSKRIYLSSPTINGKEMDYIEEAFASNWVAPLGKNVDEFEKELAASVGSRYAAALSSGTAAIHLALKYAGVSMGDTVLCSDLTFAATCNPILYEKARPVFIDSERKSWNMSPKLLKQALETFPETKAVIVANLYGVPAALDEIADLCREYGVTLIEDAAESLGASYKGKMTGTFGRLGVFSFNGNKIITTSGGGMLVSEEEEAVKKVRFWATQSREAERHYEHKEVGYNYRMSNIVAGIGRGQLKSLKEYIEKKKWIYEYYKEKLSKIEGIEMNPAPEGTRPNYWLSCMTVKKECRVRPLDMILALEKENIESRPIWKPMHLQPVFEDYECVTEEGVKRNQEKFESVSEDIFERGLCLPSDVKNTEADMEKIIKIIHLLF